MLVSRLAPDTTQDSLGVRLAASSFTRVGALDGQASWLSVCVLIESGCTDCIACKGTSDRDCQGIGPVGEASRTADRVVTLMARHC